MRDLAQYEVAHDCKLLSVQKHLPARADECNWDPAELAGRNRATPQFLPVFARVLRSFRDRYDIA